MKTMADHLDDLDSSFTVANLVHNVICGLNARLHYYIPHLTLRLRLPSLDKARSMLRCKNTSLRVGQ